MLTTRRQALKTLTAAAIASTSLGQFSSPAQTPITAPEPPQPPTGPFTLPPLPYAYDALEPHIDAETMHLHHDKHHAGYVAKLNEAVAKEPSLHLAPGANVDDLLKNLGSMPESFRTAVRNQGGGHSNHSLFWQTLSPKSSAPSGELAKALDSELGGLESFKTAAAKAGAGLFGSGWVWLALGGDKKLVVQPLPNQDSPFSGGTGMIFGQRETFYPLFGIDVWEHAYYLKYHNLRADYIKAIWNVVNWDFISQRYASALKA